MTATTVTDTVPVTVSVPPALASKLADPGVAESLSSLLSHADLVAILLEGLDGLIGRTEVIGDSLLSGIEELKGTVDLGDVTAGIDVKALVASAKGLAASMPQLAASVPQLAALATPAMTEQLALVGRGVETGSASYAADPVPVAGIFSLAKLLKDPDINRAISYAATVARAIGRELGK